MPPGDIQSWLASYRNVLVLPSAVHWVQIRNQFHLKFLVMTAITAYRFSGHRSALPIIFLSCRSDLVLAVCARRPSVRRRERHHRHHGPRHEHGDAPATQRQADGRRQRPAAAGWRRRWRRDGGGRDGRQQPATQAQVPVLRQDVLEELWPAAARAVAHRREAVPVHRVRTRLRTEVKRQEAHADAQGGSEGRSRGVEVTGGGGRQSAQPVVTTSNTT